MIGGEYGVEIWLWFFFWFIYFGDGSVWFGLVVVIFIAGYTWFLREYLFNEWASV